MYNHQLIQHKIIVRIINVRQLDTMVWLSSLLKVCQVWQVDCKLFVTNRGNMISVLVSWNYIDFFVVLNYYKGLSISLSWSANSLTFNLTGYRLDDIGAFWLVDLSNQI